MVMDQAVANRMAVLFEDGEGISITAGEAGVRFLYMNGQPLQEPVSWRGPIVMNTREEIQTAFQELDNGTFIKIR